MVPPCPVRTPLSPTQNINTNTYNDGLYEFTFFLFRINFPVLKFIQNRWPSKSFESFLWCFFFIYFPGFLYLLLQKPCGIAEFIYFEVGLNLLLILLGTCNLTTVGECEHLWPKESLEIYYIHHSIEKFRQSIPITIMQDNRNEACGLSIHISHIIFIGSLCFLSLYQDSV